MADKHFDELHVTVTTPQGTQEQGVESGHEERDINIRAVMVWFRSLAVLAIGSVLAMWAMFAVLSAFQEPKDILPSPLFSSAQQAPPPVPRLLPEPWEAMGQEMGKENIRLQKDNLADERGRSRLPANALSLVKEAQNQGAAPNQPTWQTMRALPSDSSGGTRTEWGKE